MSCDKYFPISSMATSCPMSSVFRPADAAQDLPLVRAEDFCPTLFCNNRNSCSLMRPAASAMESTGLPDFGSQPESLMIKIFRSWMNATGVSRSPDRFIALAFIWLKLSAALHVIEANACSPWGLASSFCISSDVKLRMIGTIGLINNMLVIYYNMTGVSTLLSSPINDMKITGIVAVFPAFLGKETRVRNQGKVASRRDGLLYFYGGEGEE